MVFPASYLLLLPIRLAIPAGPLLPGITSTVVGISHSTPALTAPHRCKFRNPDEGCPLCVQVFRESFKMVGANHNGGLPVEQGDISGY